MLSLTCCPATARKLKSRAPLKICIIGDSISFGCNASALSGVPPRMPPYPELWAEAIRRQRTGDVILKNFAVSGTGMKYGRVRDRRVMNEVPDLVVIAYGMNDAGLFPLEKYMSHYQSDSRCHQRAEPGTEIILVASMLGNPDWIYTPAEKFLAIPRWAGIALRPGSRARRPDKPLGRPAEGKVVSRPDGKRSESSQ